MTTRISTLPSLATVTDATIIPVVEGGATKRITGLALKTYTGTAAGPQGPSGPSGPSGANGSAGSAGATGPSGPSGPGTLNSGTTGYIPYYSGSTTLSAPTSGNLYWDNTNVRLGIGTSSPSYALDISASAGNGTFVTRITNTNSASDGRGILRLSGYNSGIVNTLDIAGGRYFGVGSDSIAVINNAAGGGITFNIGGVANSTQNEAMRINSAGTVGINETSPGTYAKFLAIRGVPGDTALPSVYISRNNNAGGGAGNPEIGLQVEVPNSYNNSGIVYAIKTFAAQNTGQTAYGGFFEAGPNNSDNYAGVYAKTTQGDTNGYNKPKGVFADVYNSNNAGNGYAFGVYSQTSDYFKHVPYAANIRYSGGDTVTVFYLQRNGGTPGSITCTASATAYNTSSDYRLKENVTNITTGLSDVMRMRPVNFTWKRDGTAGIGFIAHELQEVVPQAVHGAKDAVTKTADLDENGNSKLDENGDQLLKTEPVYQGVDSSFLVATLVAAIQELKAEFDAYKAAHP